jgi:hypothetical protein
MIHNLKLIFIHGISEQTTNYSQGLFARILAACRAQLRAQNLDDATINATLRHVVHHEVLWANLTTDLTDRYLQLAYEKAPVFWGRFTKPIDPLALQIMQYIKDKGDQHSGPGPMNILRNVDQDIRRILAETDIGEDPAPADGQHVIFIAHSLGSVIAFDYVMGFRPQHRLHPSVTVDSFITMGSPLPLFTSAMGHVDSDFVLPPNVRKWVNIRSRRDGIARPMRPFFRNIPLEEYLVSTRFLPLPAHTAYWNDAGTASLIAYEVLQALGQNV